MGAMVRRLLDRMRGPIRPRILVSGMPKSGTTALARTLGEAAGLHVVSDPFNRLDEAGINFRDSLFTGSMPIVELIRRNRPHFRGDLIKDPNFVFFTEDLLQEFPDAIFVVIVRDPRANIRSILNRLALPGRPHKDDGHLDKISETWRRVLQGRTPELPCDNYIECLARRWCRVAQICHEFEGRTLRVKYEEFNRDKPFTVSKILKTSGIPNPHPIDHMMNRQFQPAGQKGVDWGEFFGEGGLFLINTICEEGMRRFSYDPRQRRIE